MARGKKTSAAPLSSEALDMIHKEAKARLNMSGNEFMALVWEKKVPDTPEAFELSVLVNMLK